MKHYYFSINVSYERCELLYQASTNSVVLVSDNGERVQLPTKNLRPFVTRNGIKGRFRLIVTEEQKVHSFEKVA